MALILYPKPGHILMCDFREGFKPPEICKVRPVIVLSTPPGQLVTVVSLSTTRPDPVRDCNLELPKATLPQLGKFQNGESWVKGDMVYTVGWHRLDWIKLGKPDKHTGKRQYFKSRLGRPRMKEVYSCVFHGLNMGHVVQHI